MDNEQIRLIDNSKILLEHFGYFPSFHDDEIEEINLSRSEETLTVLIRSYQVGKECKFTLKFKGITDVNLEGFNNQNVINKIIFKKNGNLISASFEPSFGADITFKCERVSVEEIKKL